MKAKVQVTFDMCFDDEGGECKTAVTFTFPEHPKLRVSESVQKLVVGEIRMLCGAMNAASKELFSEGA